MLVHLRQDRSCLEIEIIIKFAQMNSEVNRISTLLDAVKTRIKCGNEDTVIWVNASDIYYIESVDKKTFVYCQNNVYRCEARLYQLLDDLSAAGFVRISKACLLNINVLAAIKPLLNSRMEATLTNDERLYVTRKYLTDIRRELQKGSLL